MEYGHIGTGDKENGHLGKADGEMDGKNHTGAKEMDTIGWIEGRIGIWAFFVRKSLGALWYVYE